MKKTCKTCAAFEAFDEGGNGECRAFPPSIRTHSSEPSPGGPITYYSADSVWITYYSADSAWLTYYSADSVWPGVTTGDRCLQWRKKEVEEDEG